MGSVFQRFSTAIRVSRPFTQSVPEKRLPLSALRQQLVDALDDCGDRISQRVAYELQITASAQDLWLMRSDVHRCISLAHSQSEASARIEAIAESFTGWLPAHQLASARRPSHTGPAARAS